MARSKFDVQIKTDKRGLEALKKTIRKLQAAPSHVRVGLLGDSKKNSRKGDGLTNGQLGLIHEFGTSTIPARPFLRPTINANADRYNQILANIAKRALDSKGSTRDRDLGLLGQAAAADVKNFITQGKPIPPPNAPATLARKQAKTRRGSDGSVRTLVDTGRMVAAITYQVVKAEKKGGKSK